MLENWGTWTHWLPKQLRSLTLTSADAISDFSVLATAGKLEELSIDSESLKSLEFCKECRS